MKTKLFSLLLIPVLFCGACSSSDDSTSSGSTSQGPHIIETNLKLKRTSEGAPYHLNEGTYKLVLGSTITDFVKDLPNEQAKQRFVNAFNYAVNTFNDLSEKIKFTASAGDEALVSYGLTYSTLDASSFGVSMVNNFEGSTTSNPIDSTIELSTNQDGLITNGSAVVNRSYLFNQWDNWIEEDGDWQDPIYSQCNTIMLRVMLYLLGFEKVTGPRQTYSIRRANYHKQTHLLTEFDKWSIKQYNHDFAGGPAVDPYVVNGATINV